jgi:hypothetical protein
MKISIGVEGQRRNQSTDRAYVYFPGNNFTGQVNARFGVARCTILTVAKLKTLFFCQGIITVWIEKLILTD